MQLNDAAAAALIHRIGEGDQAALTSLYDGTRRLLFGLILRILGDRVAAEEILLDVYTLIWKQAPNYDPNALLPLEWIITIARAQAVDKLHSSKQARRKTGFAPIDSDSAMTVSPEWQNIARASIGSLTAAQREILEWIFYSGLSCGEIATHLAKPLGAVKIHARLGMSKLSESFRPMYERKLLSETDTGGQDIEARKTE